MIRSQELASRVVESVSRTPVVEDTTWGGKEKGEETIARGQEEAKKVAADF
jgi:hypothetical protein